MLRSLLILLFVPHFLASQGEYIKDKDIIQALVNYRAKLLTENVKAVDKLRIFINNFSEIDTSLYEEFEDVTLNINYLKNICNYSNELILDIAKKNITNSKIKDEITEEYIENIASNSELIDLFLFKALNPVYPFLINPKSTIFTEVKFYQIEAGQKIGEIGAGNGTFSVILAMLNKGIQINVNDLSNGSIEYINTKIKNNVKLLDASKIAVIQGTKSKTNFSNDQFDRIIIRNSFHHFTKKDKMLKSIRNVLKPDGKLCLYEPVLDESGHEKRCKQILERKILFEIIEKNGFRLEEEKKLETNRMLLLKFIKK